MHTLFRKKRASKEEKAKYGAVPEWACLGKWTDIGKELVHYAAPVYPATSGDEEDFVEYNYESPDDVPDRRKARPVITQQRKRRVNRDQYGNAGEAHDEVNELMRGYTQMELSELAKAYKQGSDESMGEWLLRVLDAEPHTPWRTLKEAIVRVRIMGCVAGLDKDNWAGPDVEEFTQSMRSRFLRTAPNHLRATLMSLLCGASPNGIVHKITTVLAELGEFEQEEKGKRGIAAASRPKDESEDISPVKQMSAPPVKHNPNRDSTKYAISRKQMWADLVKAGVSPDKIDGISTPAI
ncbi:Hypothetical predicted protein [Pelobates cultripes]|uniref:Uncharacterized protein n=1 Tax=Pelobates cultripes TaxID=61616 RepID=A0AAD1W0I2_PELCU|nr:Hypothetical predicted protein [Pelobates cultripes]